MGGKRLEWEREMRVRHVERADVSAVLAIAGKRTVPFERGIFNDDTDYEALTESCFLSLILEKEDGTVIGAASFSDTPPAYATESAAWLKEETEARVRAVAARGAMGGSLHLESLRAPARSPLRSPARPRKPRQVAATLLRAKASARA